MTRIRQRREPDPFLADRVVARLTALVPGLTASTARAAMEAARITAPVSLWALEDHLSAHGITPASSGPLQMLKLFAILDVEGYDFPQPPAPRAAGERACCRIGRTTDGSALRARTGVTFAGARSARRSSGSRTPARRPGSAATAAAAILTRNASARARAAAGSSA